MLPLFWHQTRKPVISKFKNVSLENIFKCPIFFLVVSIVHSCFYGSATFSQMTLQIVARVDVVAPLIYSFKMMYFYRVLQKCVCLCYVLNKSFF
jgi:hypothetical protein